MKRVLVALMATLCVASVAASFGPLNPSAKPYAREYIWPEG